MIRTVNLNADLGESFGAWEMGSDAEMLATVTSANIACGFHAGDPLVMRRTLSLAKKAGVSVGAHIAYPDLQGFGRRPMTIPAPELEAIILYQLAALSGMARAEGLTMSHVKPHGALSNMASASLELARTVAAAVKAFDPALILLAPALSELSQAGYETGLPVVEEIFADRAYLDDGNLVPRRRPDAAGMGATCLRTTTGKRLPATIGSICVHGDGPNAVRTARYLREELLHRGYRLVALDALGVA